MNYGIVIPVYFGRSFIKRALDSVFAQEDVSGRLNVLIIEDGTPEPEDVESLIAGYPVQYVKLPDNHGVFYARWVGLSQLPSTVEFCAFLDQDDAWHPKFLSHLTTILMQDQTVGFVACNARVMGVHGNYVLYQDRRPNLLLADLKVANQLISPSQVLIRRDALEKLNWTIDLPYPGADDWLLWLAILSLGYQATYTDEILLDYYDHAAGAHHRKHIMAQSEEYIVEHWFPRLQLTKWDQRLYKGRIGWDHIVQGLRAKNLRHLVKGLNYLVRDPIAVNAARQFRRRHRKNHIV
ncbi:Glycosyl transferase family 2 [Sulfobacillus thermosulfidooxidans DSM 9293]|uniref:Glycosyl transferase family 2 n=1 Tax=Sulfobacillus thermosulfidooxidans (strain DSM 9293 / VKM B-1269 / AT-1) TaxID=929705 RepID=A0A1W1WE38_SULTA|nr:glycosyltransferase family A protein [Sulfobacillus thermosulfidooxidans]SMC04320.1 Glycosyl transferase family 2 [Sulfobacillus thermosulfidooxidans DSM 9293]